MRPELPSIRALLIAEQCDPEGASVPLVGWSHSQAIANLPDVTATTVTQVRNRASVMRAGVAAGSLAFVDSESVARPVWRVEEWLRGGRNRGWTTVMALRSIAYAHFERVAWRQLGAAVLRRDVDVVHRITPLSPTLAGALARQCRRADVPFVVGPLNGGLPWPRAFESTRRREGEWLSYLRGGYRLLPSYRSLRDAASAIIVGSMATLRLEPERYHSKCVYIPENAIDPSRFPRQLPPRPAPPPLRVAFVGRLVPYKGADMLVEAAAPLVRDGAVVLEIIGDGPERARIEDLVSREGVTERIVLSGWVPHASVKERLGRAHVLGFPSVREFGGAVVLESMALGVVPVVLDYGGPGELVSKATGVALPMGRRAEIVERLRSTLKSLAEHPHRVDEMGLRAQARVHRHFTWEAKARQVLEVYRWVLGTRADRPDFGIPIADLPSSVGSSSDPERSHGARHAPAVDDD